MTPAGVAIVGAGLMGSWHARAVRRAGGRVLMVVDSDRTKAASLAARYSGACVASSLEAALADAGVRIVHVCTPLSTHVPIAGAALEAGRHVLMEKPFAPSAGATRELLELARTRGCLAAPVHQFLFQRGVDEALRRCGQVGPLRHLLLTICSAGAAGHPSSRADQIAAEILPHPLSLVGLFLPGSLAEGRWAGERSAPGEWRVNGVAGGAGIQIVISMGGRPTVNELRLVGERGTVHVDLFHGYAVTEPGTVSRTRKILRPLDLAARQGLRASTNLVARAVRGEAAYPGLNALVRHFHRAVGMREGGGGEGSGGLGMLAPEETLAVAELWERLSVVRAP
jgi:predicted dehydrogenase